MANSVTSVKSAQAWAHLILKPITEDYQLEARILLCEVMQVKPELLIRYPDKTLTAAEIETFQQFNERAKGDPSPYLLSKQAFYDSDFFVTPAVLIPRPETELLVEKALAWGKARAAISIVDVGTGSGIIALTLAKHLPQAQVTGLDLSPEALVVAKHNGERLHLKVQWEQGNLLEPLLNKGATADLITANLPYIPTEELKTLPVAQHEPYLALNGGSDGLAVIRAFLEQAPRVLRPQGCILLEIGTGQGTAVQALAQAAFPQHTVTVSPDLAGQDRIVSIE